MLKKSDFDDYIRYNEVDGSFVWLKRCDKSKYTKTFMSQFNSRFAGKVAGSLSVHGYVRIQVDGVMTPAHRMAYAYVYGELDDSLEIDHINGIKTDNRIVNLRAVDRVVNSKNIKVGTRNSTGVIGVSVSRNKYVSRININKTQVVIGRYDNFFDAVCARKSIERSNGYHENHGRIK